MRKNVLLTYNDILIFDLSCILSVGSICVGCVKFLLALNFTKNVAICLQRSNDVPVSTYVWTCG